jgi:hypothetical protein
LAKFQVLSMFKCIKCFNKYKITVNIPRSETKREAANANKSASLDLNFGTAIGELCVGFLLLL